MVTPLTVPELWGRVAAGSPDDMALRDASGETWSYVRLWDRISRLALGLKSLGLQHAARVALVSRGFDRTFLEADQAVIAAGLVRVPVDPTASPAEIERQMEHAQVRAVIVDEEFTDLVPSSGLGPRFVLGSPEIERLIVGGKGPLPVVSEDDLASLNFTGGTTSDPKAVTLTQGNLAGAVVSVNQSREMSSHDVLLNVRPQWPIAGIIVLVHLLGGSGVIMGRPFQPEGFQEDVEEFQPTSTSLVPTMLVRLLRDTSGPLDHLGSLRRIDIGAASVSEARLAEAVSRLGPRLGSVYGLTEAPWTCYRSPDELVAPDGSIETSLVGAPVGDHHVTIDNAGEDAAVGETGEVVISGRHVMKGYWNNPVATNSVLQDGRLRTGDTGYLDDRGRLHIVGRIKEVIRSGGKSVIPGEVQDVIARVPGVVDVGVVGVPDDEWGERVVAAVVTSDSSLTAASIQQACRSTLAPHKRPRQVVFVSSLPRSHYGKLLIGQLTERLAGLPSEPSRPD